MKKTLSLFLFFYYILSSSGQTITFKCVLLDEETHDTVSYVKMKLICTNYTAKKILRDTLIASSDKDGLVIFHAKPAYHFELSPFDEKYRPDRKTLSSKDTAITVLYYLNPPGYTDYFQEFLFDRNSAVPQDTGYYYMWDLNTYNLPDLKIYVIGYYSPDENKKLAKKRAEEVAAGFVKRGANKDCFVVKEECRSEEKLSYGHYVKYNNTDFFFKKGAVINKAYIENLTGDRKEAAKQLLRAVRLTR